MDVYVLAAIGAMLLWGFGDFFLSKATRKTGDFLPLVFVGLIGAVMLAPKAIPLLRYVHGYGYGLLIGLGILHFAMDYFLFEGYRRGKLSAVEIIFQLELPFTVIIATTLLRERLSEGLIILILMGILGSLLLANAHRLRRHHLEKGGWWAVIAAVLSACVNTTTAFAAKDISPLLAIWFPWVIVFLISLVILWKEFDTVIVNSRKAFVVLVAAAVFQAGAWLCYTYALSGRNLSLVIGITSGYCAIAAFLGFWINRERLSKIQTLGALLAVGAAVALSITASWI